MPYADRFAPILTTRIHWLRIALWTVLALGGTLLALRLNGVIEALVSATIRFGLLPEFFDEMIWYLGLFLQMTPGARLALAAVILVAGLWRAAYLATLRFEVSRSHLVMSYGIFLRRQETIELRRVRDVTAAQPFFLVPFGAGNVTLLSLDVSAPRLRIHWAADYRRFVDALVSGVFVEGRVSQLGGLHTI